MANVLYFDIVGSEFEHHSRYNVHFQPWKRHELSYASSYGLNNTNTVLL